MLDEKYFTKEEVLDDILDYLDNNGDSPEDLDETFNNIFNSDYYIIGVYEAAKALETFELLPEEENYSGYIRKGVFGAIEYVKEYEKDNFGEVDTDLSNPEQLANMVYYIRSELVFNDVLDTAGLDLDDELTEENAKKIKKAANDMLEGKKQC